MTPQTPNFPSGVQGAGASMAAPLSPGSESREKERVTLLLDINRVLLMEVMQLQAAQAESKKEESSPKASSPDGSGDKEKKEVEKSKTTSGREYVECVLPFFSRDMQIADLEQMYATSSGQSCLPRRYR